MGFTQRFFTAAKTAIEFNILRWWRRYVALLGLVLVVLLLYGFLFSAPLSFPRNTIVTVLRGATAPQVADDLASEHVIRYKGLFTFLLRITGEDGAIQSGAYHFGGPQNLFTVAYRLTHGAYGIPPVRVTFIEGLTVRDMARRVDAAGTGITATEFLSAGGPYEGYLFPDTYLFQPSANAADMVALMRATFDRKTAPLMPAIAASGHSLAEIVTMASLLEREARTLEEKRMVAGILWNRVARGMPLQVDAVFGYIFGRDTYSPSFKDLGVDSPYNTYTHKGLPPGPIDNPGLESIEAAATPTKTPDLFYLTGTDGLMHYAKTYAEHLANERRYLR